MQESMEEGPHRGNLDLVIGWLDGQDKEKLEKAISILRRLGKPVVAFLILAAAKPGKRSEHRVRILDLVQQIGGPLGMVEMCGLQSLLQHDDPNVRAKAERVIMSMSPGGIPETPEGLAMMRAFNPFLRVPTRGRPRRTRRTRTSDLVAELRGDQAAARRRTRSIAAWQKREEREQGTRS